MKNNIKKTPVKFREDLLYFQHFMLIFCLCPKLLIITTLIKYTGVTTDWRGSALFLLPWSTFASVFMISLCHIGPYHHANETDTLKSD